MCMETWRKEGEPGDGEVSEPSSPGATLGHHLQKSGMCERIASHTRLTARGPCWKEEEAQTPARNIL